MKMNVDSNLALAEKIIQDTCNEQKYCSGCPFYENCKVEPWDWTIPDPQSEPTERQRIEWLRMLPDNEMLSLFNYMDRCNCRNRDDDCCSNKECVTKNDSWWHELVSLKQFRREMNL